MKKTIKSLLVLLMFMSCNLVMTSCGGDDDGVGNDNPGVNGGSTGTSSSAPVPVDLGLSVFWADRNVGAKDVYDRGYFFAWGETESKTTYSIDNYKDAINYPDVISGTTYDPAKKYMGGRWRLPTDAEMVELITKTNTRYERNSDNVLCMVKIGTNGQKIYIPATGMIMTSGVLENTDEGYYGNGEKNKGFTFRENTLTMGDVRKTYESRAYRAVMDRSINSTDVDDPIGTMIVDMISNINFNIGLKPRLKINKDYCFESETVTGYETASGSWGATKYEYEYYLEFTSIGNISGLNKIVSYPASDWSKTIPVYSNTGYVVRLIKRNITLNGPASDSDINGKRYGLSRIYVVGNKSGDLTTIKYQTPFVPSSK